MTQYVQKAKRKYLRLNISPPHSTELRTRMFPSATGPPKSGPPRKDLRRMIIIVIRIRISRVSYLTKVLRERIAMIILNMTIMMIILIMMIMMDMIVIVIIMNVFVIRIFNYRFSKRGWSSLIDVDIIIITTMIVLL